MNFKNWLFTEEIWQGKVATVYHRTKPKDISRLLTTSFNAGAGTGCLYGCGLYTTFSIESQFTDYMRQYGESLVKFKVTDLDKFIITHKNVARQVLGANYKVSDQLNRLNLAHLYSEQEMQQFDKDMETAQFSSDVAKDMYSINFRISEQAKGIIYNGRRDGYCLLKYPPIEDGSVTMLAYAESAPASDMSTMRDLEQDKGWTKSTGKVSLRTIYTVPEEERIAKVQTEEPSQTVTQRMWYAKNKDVMAKFIIQKYPTLNDNQVQALLAHSENKDLIIDALINKKSSISEENLEYMLGLSSNPDKVSKKLVENKLLKMNRYTYGILLTKSKDQLNLAKFIAEKFEPIPFFNSLLYDITKPEDKINFIDWVLANNKKFEMNGDNEETLLYFAGNPQKIIRFIIDKFPRIHDLRLMLEKSTDKNETISLLMKKGIEINTEVVKIFMNNTSDLVKMAEYIIANKKEFDGDDTEYLLHPIPEDQKPRIIDMLLKSGKKLDSDGMINLIYHDRDNQLKIIDYLIKNKDLKDIDVQGILHHADDKEKVAEMLGEDNFDKLGPVIQTDLIRYADNKLRMSKILLKHKKDMISFVAEFIKDMLEKDQLEELTPEEKDTLNKALASN